LPECIEPANPISSIECFLIGAMALVLDQQSTLAQKVYGAGIEQYLVKQIKVKV